MGRSERCVAEKLDRFPSGSQETRELSVASVNWKGHIKRIRLEPGPTWLDVPRSACLTTGDSVIKEGNKVWVPCDNGMCQVLPSFASPASLRLGGLSLDVLIKEITEADEYVAYEHLADLHYRSHTIHGRTARLIVRTLDPAYPKVIGFIELATPFFMNKPRSKLLDAQFVFDGVRWDSWDIHTIRKHIHRIVRIGRTVVSPEFRGFGIGRLLVEKSALFARHRWQVAGKMPYFLEISADMLKFVPFVQQAGMRYIGETDGNLSRVASDMSYLIGRFGDGQEDTTQYEQTSGILDQQVTRMKRSLVLMQERNFNTSEFTKRLERLSVRAVLKDFNLFRGIVSLPKPTYIMGLNEYSSKFIEERIIQLDPQEPRYTPSIAATPMQGALVVSGLTITYISRVRRTLATHAIQQAFDISPDDIRTTVVNNLNFKVNPGELLLVEGPSGSGKTTLLESILGNVDSNKAEVEGSIEVPEGFTPASFKQIRSRKSLIELFADNGIREGLHFLALAGLSEPFLYLKRFEELSNGQQYRAMLAHMLSSGHNVWIIDEFCSNLDEITANLVAFNVQRIARQYGVTVLVAASNPRPFIHSFRPDHVVRLSGSSEQSILTGDEYTTILGIQPRRTVELQHICISSDLLFTMFSEHVYTIIQMGRKKLSKGLIVLSCGNGKELVRVIRCTQKHFKNLTEQDAMLDEFSSLDQLKEHLWKTNSGLTDDSFITIAQLERMNTEVTNSE